jgi:TPP-dependent pyruvate/acetoin dehydrogenase alpha subunit
MKLLGNYWKRKYSEGLFFETINAAGVLQVPLVISVWDDDYGISVHDIRPLKEKFQKF